MLCRTASTSRVQNELLARPSVHVVVERGGGACWVQLRHASSTGRDRRVLVTDVTHYVAAEVGTIRARGTAEPPQLLYINNDNDDNNTDTHCS